MHLKEYVPEEERKPPYSYASLIRLAILNSPGQKATLSDIYKWIQDQFLYYKNQINIGWKNSIRHNLSLNKCFMKVSRSRHDPGKGCYWAINHLYSHDKTPFEKRKKPVIIHDIAQLQESYLKTIQQAQLKILMTEATQSQAMPDMQIMPPLYPIPPSIPTPCPHQSSLLVPSPEASGCSKSVSPGNKVIMNKD